MKRYEVKDHAPSYLPEEKEWKLIWADEFDGTELDETKWDYRTNMMGQRCKHWVKEEGISFDGNSNIIFTLIEKNGEYCSTQLQTGYNFMDGEAEAYDPMTAEGNVAPTENKNYFKWPIGAIKQPKFQHKYGYYECRFKLAQKEGWWSAFWLQSPIFGATLNPGEVGVEVDIMEAFYHTAPGPNNVISHNNHWNGYGSQHMSTNHQDVEMQETEDGFHTVGLEWTKEGYRYFVDGRMTWEVKEPVSHREQFILLSTEVIGYRSSEWNDWEAVKNAVGDQFVVDYVRVFDVV